MAPTVLRVTDLKNSNFSWSDPEIIIIIKCIMIVGLIPLLLLLLLLVLLLLLLLLLLYEIRPIIIIHVIMLIISVSDQLKFESLSSVTRKTVGTMRIVAIFRAERWYREAGGSFL